MSSLSKKWIILMLTVYLLITSVILLNIYPAEPLIPVNMQTAMAEGERLAAIEEELANTILLEFSHTEHFYDTDIEVAITASIPDAVIYYTLDGSEPTSESEVYTQPILIEAAEFVNRSGTHPLKATAVYEDIIADTLVHTYFVANDVFDRFDTVVFSLSTNDDFLYDYDTGIMVEGRERAEYRKANPGVQIDPPAPANFNWRGMESERPVFIEVFEPDGNRVISQYAGMRIHGGWSRAASQKSLRLIARNMYERTPGEGRFNYDFFPDDVRADGFDTPITRYDQLILSNNANDREFGMLRQEVNYSLARKAGLRITSPFRAASVFLNGEYYGFAWLQVNMNEQYLETVYSAPTKEFQIVGNGELWIASEDEDDIEAIEYLESFYDKDFTDDAVMEEFESLVDIENLMLYYAYQTYAGNRDWPNNNMKRWRYTGPTEEGLAVRGITDEQDIDRLLAYDYPADELDGRWRFITYDLDFLMGLYEGDVRAHSPSFAETMRRGNDRHSYMLSALFARAEMADKYAMYVCDIAYNILTPENVAAEIDRLYEEAYNEIGNALSAYKYSHWVGRGSIEGNHQNMIEYTRRRPNYFLGGMIEHFGWDDGMFTVAVTDKTGNGSRARIGSMVTESSAYFMHLEIPVSPSLSRDERFDHWILNGEIITTADITVTIADADENNVVHIELVTYSVPPPELIISSAFGTSENNGAVLLNTSDYAVTTAGLFFTDDLTNRHLWAMPMATIEPGNELEFAGRSSRSSDDIHKIQMGFNVREGRILYLCNESGEVIDWFIVNS